MLHTLWNDFITSYEAIIGTGSFLVLFVVMLGVMIVYKNHNDKPLELIPMLMVMPAVIAAGFVRILRELFNLNYDSKLKKYFVRILGVILCAFVIMISGDRVLSPSFYTYADNNMHLPTGLKETMDTILNDCDGEASVMVTKGYIEYFDAYSSRFVLAYNEPRIQDVSDYDEEDREAYLALDNKHPDMKKVSDSAKANGSDYIVLVTGGYWPDVPLTEFGYDLFAQVGGFDIYKLKEGAL